MINQTEVTASAARRPKLPPPTYSVFSVLVLTLLKVQQGEGGSSETYTEFCQFVFCLMLCSWRLSGRGRRDRSASVVCGAKAPLCGGRVFAGPGEAAAPS